MSLKVFTLIMLVAVISGCTDIKQNETAEEANSMQNISISTDAFQSGGTIPSRYTCDGEDVSPALTWSGVPEGTKSIALIMDDPDAPGRTFVHWVLYNIPANTRKLPEAVPKAQTLNDGSRHGRNDFMKDRIGYRGPCPPPGKPHRYYFRIYALDTELDLPPGASRAEVEKAMKGHVLGSGELMGKYGR